MTDARSEGSNFGLILAIVAVATIGGFLFGYDSGAVNGTQDGLKATFGLSEGGNGGAGGDGSTFNSAEELIACLAKVAAASQEPAARDAAEELHG